MARTARLWSFLGLAGFILLPWYMVAGGVLSFRWINEIGFGPALLQLGEGRWWLAGPGLALLVALIVAFMPLHPVKQARLWVICGAAGLALLAGQGLMILGTGPRIAAMGAVSQPGMGLGAFVVAMSLLFVMTTGISG